MIKAVGFSEKLVRNYLIQTMSVPCRSPSTCRIDL